MKRLQLDFSSYAHRRRRLSGVIAVVLLLPVAAGVMAQHGSVLDRIAQIETSADAGVARHGRHLRPSAADQAEMKMAVAAQRTLNLPWDGLLDALEQAQSRSGKIHLLSVQPNPARSEVTVSGEAANFAALMDYVKTLREQAALTDVTLVNQRHVEVEDDERPRLAFTLTAGWRI